MDHKPLAGSVIASTGHEGTVMEIRFKSGRTYAYSPISALQHEQLRAAASPGAHFAYHIRPKYTGTPVSGTGVRARKQSTAKTTKNGGMDTRNSRTWGR